MFYNSTAADEIFPNGIGFDLLYKKKQHAYKNWNTSDNSQLGQCYHNLTDHALFQKKDPYDKLREPSADEEKKTELWGAKVMLRSAKLLVQATCSREGEDRNGVFGMAYHKRNWARNSFLSVEIVGGFLKFLLIIQDIATNKYGVVSLFLVQ